MKIKFILVLSLFSIFTESCNQKPTTQEVDNQLVIENVIIPKSTQKEGVLTVLLDNSLTSYFIYQGEAMGYEYEMLALLRSPRRYTGSPPPARLRPRS